MPQRKISRGPPDLIRIIFEVANFFSIEQVDYVLEFGSEDVDYFLDGIYKVCIKGVRRGLKVRKKCIVKWHSDPNKRDTFREAYQREFLFYNHIVPKIIEMQNAFEIIEGLKMKFLNCIFSTIESGKEAIVVADPSEQGFRFHDRFHKLDLDHVSLAVKNLAKLHALSFVLEKSQPRDFEVIKKSCYTDVQYSDTERMFKCMISYYYASVNVVKDPALQKRLQDCAPDILNILNKCVMPKTKYRTICHGDYWNNNILFKYSKNKPVDTIFVDNQLVRYASPVTDISYYLYMSTDHEFREKHYDRVLSLYFETLTAVLRQCNLDISEIYPKEVFRQHLKEYSVFGLIEALISMKIITAMPDDALKMTEMIYECCEDGLREDELQNGSTYVERVNGVVNEFFAHNYSLDTVIKNE